MRAVVAAAVATLALATPALAGTNLVEGKLVFKLKCGSCHTLAAAGTHATSAAQGPVLTNLRVSYSKVMGELYGAGGAMPTMATVLTQAQMTDVADYVVKATRPQPKKK